MTKVLGLNSRQWFYLFCSTHFILCVLLPALTFHNLPHDTTEGIAWGNLWLLGYDKHPPLAPWLSAFVTQISGYTGWPMFVLSEAAVVLCFWSVWRLALHVVDPWQALVAVIPLEGIYYYNIESVNFDPNIAMLPTWGLLCLGFYNALRKQNIQSWAIVGLLAGVATLAKYESAILFIVLIFFLILNREARRSFTRAGPYVGFLVALVVVAPNLAWVANHNFISFRYAFGSLGFDGWTYAPAADTVRFYEPLKFLLEQVGVLLPLTLLFSPFFRTRERTPRPDSFTHQYIRFLAIGPLLVTLVLAVLTHADLISRWGVPFFSFIGLALIVELRPQVTAARLKVFLLVTAVWMVALGIAAYWTLVIRPYDTHKPSYTVAYPGREISDYVTRAWRAHYGSSLPYVIGKRRLVATVAAYSPDRPVPFFDANPRTNPWVDKSALARRGGIVVAELHGDDGEKQIAAWKKRFPTLRKAQLVLFREATRAPVPPVKIWFAVVPPSDDSSVPRKGRYGQNILRPPRTTSRSDVSKVSENAQR